ncbi:MAG: hypothetical protein JWM68_698 [Verrucomicrobiales bacterium]|nr:hypothetical protein [Verrucomicrobiales bacterium]
MTVVANGLLETALRGSKSWQVAESATVLKEAPPPFAARKSV